MEKNIAAQIESFTATLHAKVDLDQPTVDFFREHFYKDQTLALACYHCCSMDPCAAIFDEELGSDIETSAMWDRISNLIESPIGQKYSVKNIQES